MKSTLAPPPPAAPPLPSVPTTATKSRLPLTGWSLELARRWNGGTYSLFVLHGNIFDLFPVQQSTNPPIQQSVPLPAQQSTNPPIQQSIEYVSLKSFLVRRLFPERACMLFYDISDGLTFGSSDMQKRFFEWLAVYDNVEKTNFAETGPPRESGRLATLLRRFFPRVSDEK